MPTATITPVELTFDESLHARGVFNSVCDDYARSEHALRQVLSKLGMFPPDEQITIVYNHFGGKVSLLHFTRYLMFLKGVARQPEPRDADTLRAFAALGGGDASGAGGERGGCVNADYLRAACKRFELAIDIEKLIAQVDSSGNGQIDYDEFAQLWRMGGGSAGAMGAMLGGASAAAAASGDGGENSGMTKSFWMSAVRHAHENVNDDDFSSAGNAVTFGASANSNADGRDSDTSSVREQQQPTATGLRISFPEAARVASAGVALAGPASGAGSESDEMPHAEQLLNYLQTGNTCGLTDEQIAALREQQLQEEQAAQRRRSMAANQGSSMRPGMQTSAMMMARSQQLMMGNRYGSQSLRSGAAAEDGAASSQNVLSGASRSGIPPLMLGNNNNGATGTATNDHDDDEYHFGSDATPADVLKAASEFLTKTRKDFRSDKCEREMTEKLNTMSSARPAPIGGIYLSERRNEGIELPDPMTVGAVRRADQRRYVDQSPLSARAQKAVESMSKKAMVSPRSEAMLGTARMTSMKRGWRA